MDATEVILLTALVNIIITGLISGVVIYRIQRKIDSSFAEKIEKMRSNLQLSNFEQQTKFARNHEKAVEVLETLLQKFIDFKMGFNHMVLASQRTTFSLERAQTFLTEDDIDSKYEIFISIMDYHARNRHVLPISTIIAIQKVFASVNTLFLLTRIAGENYRTKLPLSEMIRFLYLPANSPVLVEVSNLNIRGIEDKTITLHGLLSDIAEEMNRQGRILEGLYKKYSGTGD